MRKIIPRDLIRHLEWNPKNDSGKRTGENPPNKKKRKSRTKEAIGISPNIEALVKSRKTFYNPSLPNALEKVRNYALSRGITASMPYLIAGKAKSTKKNYLWKDWFTALSEENIGVDRDGIFVQAGKPVVITVHGGGILTPDRIRQAYRKGLTGQSAAKYTDEEFENLLKGILPDGNKIEIYSIDDVRGKKIPNPFGRYGVFLNFESAKATVSGYLRSDDFMASPLVISRAGTLEYLSAYFNKAKADDGTVGCWHRLNEIDFHQPQGRLLFLYAGYDGLDGDYGLDDDGRFVGVAPEALRAKK